MDQLNTFFYSMRDSDGVAVTAPILAGASPLPEVLVRRIVHLPAFQPLFGVPVDYDSARHRLTVLLEEQRQLPRDKRSPDSPAMIDYLTSCISVMRRHDHGERQIAMEDAGERAFRYPKSVDEARRFLTARTELLLGPRGKSLPPEIAKAAQGDIDSCRSYIKKNAERDNAFLRSMNRKAPATVSRPAVVPKSYEHALELRDETRAAYRALQDLIPRGVATFADRDECMTLQRDLTVLSAYLKDNEPEKTPEQLVVALAANLQKFFNELSEGQAVAIASYVVKRYEPKRARKPSSAVAGQVS